MQEVSEDQVLSALRTLGVQAGDGLLVHSALHFLGRPANGPGMYLDAVCAAVDAHNHEGVQSGTGTIAVPTFNFAFARGEAYDPETTPSAGMGVFAELVRNYPQSKRTPHPMQSLAVIGAEAADLARRDTPSAFDAGSAFERMVELGFKILLLGADIEAVSLLHYSEQRFNVPYRYWKNFTGLVHGINGWEERTYRMFVRDMQLDPKLTLKPVQEFLQAKGQFSSTPLNYGQVAVINMTDFVAAVDHFLAEDPFSLMLNRPGIGQ
jgi:aminoglycoside 3-N-acetyltransferase